MVTNLFVKLKVLNESLNQDAHYYFFRSKNYFKIKYISTFYANMIYISVYFLKLLFIMIAGSQSQIHRLIAGSVGNALYCSSFYVQSIKSGAHSVLCIYKGK